MNIRFLKHLCFDTTGARWNLGLTELICSIGKSFRIPGVQLHDHVSILTNLALSHLIPRLD